MIGRANVRILPPDEAFSVAWGAYWTMRLHGIADMRELLTVLFLLQYGFGVKLPILMVMVDE